MLQPRAKGRDSGEKTANGSDSPPAALHVRASAGEGRGMGRAKRKGILELRAEPGDAQKLREPVGKGNAADCGLRLRRRRWKGLVNFQRPRYQVFRNPQSSLIRCPLQPLASLAAAIFEHPLKALPTRLPIPRAPAATGRVDP